MATERGTLPRHQHEAAYRMRTTDGAAANGNINVPGITTDDTILDVYNLTDRVHIQVNNVTIRTADTIRISATTAGDDLLVIWSTSDWTYHPGPA